MLFREIGFSKELIVNDLRVGRTTGVGGEMSIVARERIALRRMGRDSKNGEERRRSWNVVGVSLPTSRRYRIPQRRAGQAKSGLTSG